MEEESIKQYNHPLSERYSSEEMKYIFSSHFKFKNWRSIWIALAESEKDLGLPISNEQIEELKKYKDDINIEIANQREKEVKHDVMAHVYAYSQQCPKASKIIHLGATSALVTDNADVIMIKSAMKVNFR